MQLQDIQADIYTRLNYSSSPPAAVVSRILAFINQRYRRILTQPGMGRLREANTTFNTAAGTPQYTLNAAIQRISAVYDAANMRRLAPGTLDWLRSADPGLVTTGAPAEVWIPVTQNATHQWTIQIWPTPSSIVAMSVDYTAALTDLASATDEPLIPPDFQWIVAAGARADELEHLKDDRYKIALADYLDGISKLRAWVVNNPDKIYIPGETPDRRSSLGSWFPPGS